MTTIHYITSIISGEGGTLENIIKVLKRKYAKVEFKKYERSQTYTIQNLLLIEPYEIINEETKYNEAYTCPSPIWKKYLTRKSPNIKLIVAGNDSYINNTNYLYLFNLPDNLALFLEEAKPVIDEEAYPFTKEKRKESQKVGKLYLRGIDMADKLEQFFRGHGYNSVIDVIEGLAADIESIRGTLLTDEADITEEDEEIIGEQIKTLEKEWHTFYSRWKHYYPLWKYVPFEEAMKKCNDLIPPIATFMQQQLPNMDTVVTQEELNQLKELKNLLSNEFQPILHQIEKKYLIQ